MFCWNPSTFSDPTLEHTLIVVKPDGYARSLTGEILRRIEAKGYDDQGPQAHGRHP